MPSLESLFLVNHFLFAFSFSFSIQLIRVDQEMEISF
jgi:hypothetical protein